MTHLPLNGGAMQQPQAMRSRQVPTQPSPARPALPHPLSGQMLLPLQIASRRARLAKLEAEMIAACEAAALGSRSRTNATCEREHWNRATWHRYLAAAMRLEATYGPRMRRLRQEIGQLERLTTLMNAAWPAAWPHSHPATCAGSEPPRIRPLLSRPHVIHGR